MRSTHLEDIINELELISDDGVSFLHKSTGKLIHLNSYELKIRLNTSTNKKNFLGEENFIETDYLKLPTKNEIDEHGLMKNFLRSNLNQSIIKEVINLEQDNNINYWQLRKIIQQLNIGDEWYRYKREAFKKISIEWCSKNVDSIPFSILKEIQLHIHT